MLALSRDEYLNESSQNSLVKLKILAIVLSVSVIASSSDAKERVPGPIKSFIVRKLDREKFNPEFARLLMRDYETKDFHSVLELNILLYLRKSDYHGPQVSDVAVFEVKEFRSRYMKALSKAEARFGVSAFVVASLLWMESRLGKNMGDFHVPSVYLHLLQGPRKSVQNLLISRAGKFSDSVTVADQKEIVARTHRKAKWAIEELRALQRVHGWKWKIQQNLRGSFSGAFGIPQFLPSSYARWARPFIKSRQPFIDLPEDAIMSVAYYLKDHGWNKANDDMQLSALYKYNNSHDYAAAILELAKRVETESQVSESDRTK